jgi:GT2 family glycosyltransferase
MNIFAMVTTRHSHNYTNHAVRSLVEHSRLDLDDEVILIDNDADYSGLPADCPPKVKVLRNDAPRSFAANVNHIIDLARPRQATVVFLNNDLVFSRGWYEPLRPDGAYLLSPLSNAELQYSEGGLDCRLGMDLEEYLGKEQAFREIVRRHRNRVHGYLKVMSFAFFAVKIPYSVYSVVGNLDESFGVGGGEDRDYCIRCYQAGFELRYALNSYILHFQGKSTWRGAETREQTAARNRFYTERFIDKWGTALFNVACLNDLNKLPADLREAHEKGDFARVIAALKPQV